MVATKVGHVLNLVAIGVAAFAIGFGAAAISPAFADSHDGHHEGHDGHEWHNGHWGYWGWHNGVRVFIVEPYPYGYYAPPPPPPVYYAPPPPPPVYYAPPPVVVGPSFGIFIH